MHGSGSSNPGSSNPENPDAGGRADLSAALDLDLADRLMGRLFALAPRLVELLDLGAREYGMSYARGRVVAALHASGPVPMRKVSEDVGVSPRTITGLIDALEKDGWVERGTDPSDRRVTIVALTPVAEVAFARLLESYSGLARDLVDGISAADQQRVVGVLDHIAARMDDALSRDIAALQADPPPLPRDQGRADSP